MKFESLDAIEALWEFCNAAMYREHKIRNMHAYLLNIIKRRGNPAGNRMSKSSYISYKGRNRPHSSREWSKEPSSISESQENYVHLTGDEHSEELVGDISIHGQPYKPFKDEFRKPSIPDGGEVNDKVSISFTNERNNTSDLKSWEPRVSSRALLPERFNKEMRYSRTRNCRRVCKYSKKSPFSQREQRCGRNAWSTNNEEIDALSNIVSNGADFTSGCLSYPFGDSQRDLALCHFEHIKSELNSIEKAYIYQDWDIVDRYIVERFPDLLDIADWEPGAYPIQNLRSHISFENALIDV